MKFKYPISKTLDDEKIDVEPSVIVKDRVIIQASQQFEGLIGKCILDFVPDEFRSIPEVSLRSGGRFVLPGPDGEIREFEAGLWAMKFI